jgi:guanylate kinase
MNNGVLSLFEGLSERQARKFRAAIVPTLQELKARIITENEQDDSRQSKRQEARQDEMQSKNGERATVQNAALERE